MAWASGKSTSGAVNCLTMQNVVLYRLSWRWWPGSCCLVDSQKDRVIDQQEAQPGAECCARAGRRDAKPVDGERATSGAADMGRAGDCPAERQQGGHACRRRRGNRRDRRRGARPKGAGRAAQGAAPCGRRDRRA